MLGLLAGRCQPRHKTWSLGAHLAALASEVEWDRYGGVACARAGNEQGGTAHQAKRRRKMSRLPSSPLLVGVTMGVIGGSTYVLSKGRTNGSHPRLNFGLSRCALATQPGLPRPVSPDIRCARSPLCNTVISPHTYIANIANLADQHTYYNKPSRRNCMCEKSIRSSG